MLNRITAILLIFSLTSVNCTRFFVYAGFEMNKSYIASKLCENRNKPWLHCNGKCYLAKKIRQAEEKQNSAERESQKNLFQEAYCTKNTEIKFYTHLLQIISIPNNRIELQQGYSAIFRPPQIG
jgi:hypothetical protein